MLDRQEARRAIRNTYKGIAEQNGGCCGGSCSCCGGTGQVEASLSDLSGKLGYSPDDIASVADGANMGLGCGSPLAYLSLKEGDIVLDLGSGGGFDCFLARGKVGLSGRVIGVDMTPEMVDLARENAARQGYDNVEFRLGEIEHLPVPDESVDVVISNCVINLSLEKDQVFREVFRVLTPGGKLSISDIVSTEPLPEDIRENMEMLSGCVAGAVSVDELEQLLREAGFENIQMQPKDNSSEILDCWSDQPISDFVASFIIQATKPTK